MKFRDQGKMFEVQKSQDSISQIKADKIALLSKQCQERIINGIDFTWDEGTVEEPNIQTHHYSLDLPDQIDITALYNNILKGCTKTSWHYNGGACEEWKADKFSSFAQQAMLFVTYTKTRFNSGIRPLVESLENIEEINAVTLDTELSEEVNLYIQQMIENALGA